MMSHQSGTILHHWNDPPSTIIKNRSAASSVTSLGVIPTPPRTPSADKNELARGLTGLLNMPSSLIGRNKDMVFAKVQGLIKTVEDQKLPGSLCWGFVVNGRFTEDRIGRYYGRCRR